MIREDAMIEKVDHIGIAVHSIESALCVYEKLLGLTLIGEEIVESQGVKVAFLETPSAKIELLEPLEQKGAIFSFLNKRGEGIHHIAFRVQNIRAKIQELESKGLTMIDNKPRIGARGALIAFLHPSSTHKVLIELCEKGGDQRV
jgi:methylmalonyl-CoA/ethylmalonyl-CoA epimerase